MSEEIDIVLAQEARASSSRAYDNVDAIIKAAN